MEGAILYLESTRLLQQSDSAPLLSQRLLQKGKHQVQLLIGVGDRQETPSYFCHFSDTTKISVLQLLVLAV